MTTRIAKLWIGGEQRPENWYYTKTITKEVFISELCRFIVEGAQYDKLEEIKEKIKEMGCMYGKLILL